MSTVDRKELMNEADAAIYTGGAVLIGMTSKKLLKEPLGTPSKIKDGGNGRRTNTSKVCTKQKMVTYRPIR